tara:strand:+ start:358 stop:1053 length:696 start_codon:yes stop_codon:yes gene_type:complete
VDKGRLHIVSSPIGNLADITYRAVETLNSVSKIAAEDTRRTRILLDHYKINTPVSSYNSFNKLKKGPDFVADLKHGMDLAVVSDAGTPGVSDPLYHLVQMVLDEGLGVVSVPGPSAAIAGLTVSGLPMDRFTFEGFLPRKKRRARTLQALVGEKRTVVLYESPHRISKTLRELSVLMGNRPAAIARELTKLHEEVIRGQLEDLAELAEKKNWKGEITLLIGGADERPVELE